eukprot:6177934-Pleurochrysis_carterae.AAC.2
MGHLSGGEDEEEPGACSWPEGAPRRFVLVRAHVEHAAHEEQVDSAEVDLHAQTALKARRGACGYRTAVPAAAAREESHKRTDC